VYTRAYDCIVSCIRPWCVITGRLTPVYRELDYNPPLRWRSNATIFQRAHSRYLTSPRYLTIRVYSCTWTRVPCSRRECVWWQKEIRASGPNNGWRTNRVFDGDDMIDVVETTRIPFPTFRFANYNINALEFELLCYLSWMCILMHVKIFTLFEMTSTY